MGDHHRLATAGIFGVTRHRKQCAQNTSYRGAHATSFGSHNIVLGNHKKREVIPFTCEAYRNTVGELGPADVIDNCSKENEVKMKTFKFRSGALAALTIGALFVTGGLVTAGGASAATASASTFETQSDVAKFAAWLEESPETYSSGESTIDQFEALSAAQQERFVEIITSDSPFDAPEVVQTESGSKGQAKVNAGGGVQALATIYDVTAEYTAYVQLFGITIAKFDQTFKYQTGSGVVLTTQYCHGSFTGLSGFWSISSSDSRYVASGQGYCITDFRLSVVYEGSNASMNKRMTTITNGPGIVSQSIVNV